MDRDELTNGGILYTNGLYEKYARELFKVIEVGVQVF